MDAAARALDLLAERGDTLATAESLTGGRVASALTGVPGASRSFRGGVVAYATQVKVSVLGVAPEVVADGGVISAACAAAMADGARRVLGATYALATTGAAGPDPQDGHPPGTVHVCVAGPRGAHGRELALAGTRTEIQDATVEAVLALLLDVLLREEPDLG